jgi:bifunctional DNA-binding transcriptional regulator/antitoxin component of YhaV-PrlF toxin-antitoxin module
MLTGQELLAFVKANPETNQRDLAVGAGYTRTTKKGEQVLVKTFYHALLAAQGTALPIGRGTGKPANYITTVHSSGIILLGKTYSEKFGVEPGNELDILIEEDCIRLVPRPLDTAPTVTTAKQDRATGAV